MLLLWVFAELLLLDCHMMWFLYSEANTKQFLLSCDTTTIFYIQGWLYIEEENRPLPKSSPVGISLKMESHSCMHKVVLNDRILLSAISSFLVCPVQMRKKKAFCDFFQIFREFFLYPRVYCTTALHQAAHELHFLKKVSCTWTEKISLRPNISVFCT